MSKSLALMHTINHPLQIHVWVIFNILLRTNTFTAFTRHCWASPIFVIHCICYLHTYVLLVHEMLSPILTSNTWTLWHVRKKHPPVSGWPSSHLLIAPQAISRLSSMQWVERAQWGVLLEQVCDEKWINLNRKPDIDILKAPTKRWWDTCAWGCHNKRECLWNLLCVASFEAVAFWESDSGDLPTISVSFSPRSLPGGLTYSSYYPYNGVTT